MKTFKAPAVISKIMSMADNSLRLQMDCQEMSPEDEAIVLGARNKYGWFAFREGEEEIGNEEIPDVKLPKRDEDRKSQSQRIRGIIYLLWEQGGKKDLYGNSCDSETYYNQYTERLIEKMKEKLN